MNDNGYWDHIEDAYNDFCECADRNAWLALFQKHPEWVCDLIAAHWILAEVDNGGLMQFFLNDSGYIAPEAISAFRRMGLPEAQEAISAAVLIFGKDFPYDKEVREILLWAKAGLEPQDNHYALFKSDIFTQMEESLCKAGGGTFDGIYGKMDGYAQRNAT